MAAELLLDASNTDDEYFSSSELKSGQMQQAALQPTVLL